jgi:hypothetical protein
MHTRAQIITTQQLDTAWSVWRRVVASQSCWHAVVAAESVGVGICAAVVADQVSITHHHAHDVAREHCEAPAIAAKYSKLIRQRARTAAAATTTTTTAAYCRAVFATDSINVESQSDD